MTDAVAAAGTAGLQARQSAAVAGLRQEGEATKSLIGELEKNSKAAPPPRSSGRGTQVDFFA